MLDRAGHAEKIRPTKANRNQNGPICPIRRFRAIFRAISATGKKRCSRRRPHARHGDVWPLPADSHPFQRAAHRRGNEQSRFATSPSGAGGQRHEDRSSAVGSGGAPDQGRQLACRGDDRPSSGTPRVGEALHDPDPRSTPVSGREPRPRRTGGNPGSEGKGRRPCDEVAALTAVMTFLAGEARPVPASGHGGSVHRRTTFPA